MHADYVARSLQNDGRLIERIIRIKKEDLKEHIGLPVIELKDGTKQIYSYYKYATVVQYLIQVKKLDFLELCDLDSSLEDQYNEMLQGSRKNKD